jgi:hypothetical protein
MLKSIASGHSHAIAGENPAQVRANARSAGAGPHQQSDAVRRSQQHCRWGPRGIASDARNRRWWRVTAMAIRCADHPTLKLSTW